MEQNNNIEIAAEQNNEAVESVAAAEASAAVETAAAADSTDTAVAKDAVEQSEANQAVIAAAQAEHSELPVSASETAIAAAAPVEIAAVTEKPKKKGYLKMLISAVLACGVVVGGLWAARTYLVPPPEAVIKKAAVATAANQQKLGKTIEQDIPALLPLFDNYSYKDGQSDFVFTVDSIEEVPYARMVSALISGF